jgi:hypothetical protein
MFKRMLAIGFCVLLLSACTTCVLMRSEYYDITGKVFTPKTPDQEITIYKEPVNRPFTEIGFVKVLARYGTSHQAIDAQMKKRAREAGADALIDVQYGEDKANNVKMCGMIGSTRRNISASGRAIVFTPLEKTADQNVVGEKKPLRP